MTLKPFIIMSIIMLLLAILPIWPYGYYMLLRLVVCGTAVYIAYNVKMINKQGWMWTMVFIALLFNPLIPIHLDKVMWSFIDLIVAVAFITLVFKMKAKTD